MMLVLGLGTARAQDGPYRYVSAVKAPHAAHNVIIRGTPAGNHLQTFAKGRMVRIGNRMVADVPGSRNLRVVVDPKVGGTRVAGLTFKRAVAMNIWKDGTVVVNRTGVQAIDDQGNPYLSTRIKIRGASAIVMIPAPQLRPPLPRTVSLEHLRRAGPLCGARLWLHGTTDAQRQAEITASRSRIAALMKADAHTTWGNRVARVAASENETGNTIMYLIGKMGVLFNEQQVLKEEMSKRLLARFEAIPKEELLAWANAARHLTSDQAYRADIEGNDGIVYGMRLKQAQDMILVDLMFTLLPVEPLFRRERYNLREAARYRGRLKQISMADVRLLQVAMPAFEKAELDAALSLTLMHRYFPAETFSRNVFLTDLARLLPRSAP
jgi:hypothetical protein